MAKIARGRSFWSEPSIDSSLLSDYAHRHQLESELRNSGRVLSEKMAESTVFELVRASERARHRPVANPKLSRIDRRSSVL